MAPMVGAPQQCFIPKAAAANATVHMLNVTVDCAELAKPAFVWYTLPVWLLLASAMLIEFYWIQSFTVFLSVTSDTKKLRACGRILKAADGLRPKSKQRDVVFNVAEHSMLIVCCVVLTYALLEAMLMNDLFDPDTTTAYQWQLYRVVGLVACAWPFVGSSLWLLHRYGVLVDAVTVIQARVRGHLGRKRGGQKSKTPNEKEEVAKEKQKKIQRQESKDKANADAAAERDDTLEAEEKKTCWRRVMHHRHYVEVYEKSSVHRASYWSDIEVGGSKKNSGESEQEKQVSMFEISRTMSTAQNFKKRLRDSGSSPKSGRIPTLHSTLYFWVGLLLLIANWAWLQMFVQLYMENATTKERISIGTLIFNGSEKVFGEAVKFVRPPVCTLI
jgi:hypothetical protein